MFLRHLRSLAALGLLLSLASPGRAQSTPSAVRFQTNFGNIDVNLLPNVAPATVANFMN